MQQTTRPTASSSFGLCRQALGAPQASRTPQRLPSCPNGRPCGTHKMDSLVSTAAGSPG